VSGKSNLEFLAFEETPLGPICLRRRELLSKPGTFVTEVTLNHEFLMSSLYTASEQELARFAMEMHGGQSLHVMIAGLRLGYTAAAVLQSEHVVRVEVIELLPQVVGWMQDGLVPLSSRLADEPRLVITHGDAYRRLAEPPATLYDLILIDVDHSPDERLGDGRSAAFYTIAGLQAAKRHLRPSGVLGVWSYSESSPFTEALQACFEEVRAQPVTHDNELIGERHTDWLFFAR
jgi:spermidine synthase